jgi:hypothetical protein
MEVTTETHFVASAILRTPYLSFSVGCICLIMMSSPYAGSLITFTSGIAPINLSKTERGVWELYGKWKVDEEAASSSRIASLVLKTND